MLIDCATSRLAVDLFESLRKNKIEVTEIRVSYFNKLGQTSYKTFATYDDFKNDYIDTYQNLVASKPNPFTYDRKFALTKPLLVNGIMYGNSEVGVNVSMNGMDSLGSFMKVERFKAFSTSFNYDIDFICRDVSNLTTYSILEGNTVDNRRNSGRNAARQRHYNSLDKFINQYQIILERLKDVYNLNLYVDLSYVTIGYVEDSLKLYSIFFMIVKKPLNSGIKMEVLNKIYLRRNMRDK